MIVATKLLALPVSIFSRFSLSSATFPKFFPDGLQGYPDAPARAGKSGLYAPAFGGPGPADSDQAGHTFVFLWNNSRLLFHNLIFFSGLLFSDNSKQQFVGFEFWFVECAFSTIRTDNKGEVLFLI